MSAASFLPWQPPQDTSMAKADCRDIVMVAGTDPYACKGTEDIAKAFVRPEGQGGCINWESKEKQEYSN